ncbi:MAG: hypothetical protein SVM86_00195 [Candidatus Cloacimonadota bacterium]|nr:hypothetical protein [Candidatus Cloacimonadota bacterium]
MEKKKKMTTWNRMQHLDRRYIYIVVAVAIIIPLLIPFNTPTYVTEPTANIYKKIDSFADREDKAILMSFNHDASTMPELFPMEVSILRHCFERNVKVFTLCFLPQAAPLVDYAINTAKEGYDVTSGVDYLNFGYRPYALQLPIILGMGEDISEALETDSEGRKIDNLKIMENIRNYDDMNLVIDFSGSASIQTWIIYARAKFGANIAAGITAVMVADNYPYLQTGQLVGMLRGLKGAAEYEKLVDVFAAYKDEEYPNGRPYSQEILKEINVPITAKNVTYDITDDEGNVERVVTDRELQYDFKKARIGMNAQSVAHIMIIFFILVGNIGYFITRKNKQNKLG